MDPVTIGELTVAGGAILVAYKVVDFSITAVRRRNGKNGNGIIKVTDLACQSDPSYIPRIKEIGRKIQDIHVYTEANKETMSNVRQGVASGGFACVWQGRDEVRSFFESIRELTREVKSLTMEMKKVNNGNQ